MMIKKYFEEFIIGDGYKTAGRIITASSIDFHAEESGDYFPHHMDAEWCSTQPFKKRMAHGTLIFTIAVGLTAREINEASMTYGYDRLRFIKPVFINDTIYVVASIIDKKDHKREGMGIITEKVEAYNQHNELVMACEHLLLVHKSPAA